MKKNKSTENNIITKNFNATIISSIITIFLGILLFFQAENTLKMISYIIGIFLLVVGIASIIKTTTNKQVKLYINTSFMIGTFSSIVGFILLINPTILTSILPFCIGGWLIISGALKIQTTFALKETLDDTWKKMLIYAIVVLMLGIILITNPFGGAVFATKVIGIFLIIYSIADIVGTFMIKKEIKEEIKEEIKIIDAEE